MSYDFEVTKYFCKKFRINTLIIDHYYLGLSWEKKIKKHINKSKNKSDLSVIVGKNLAKIALSKKITKVVFDRNGYPFHGRVKAFADAAREAGLEF